jgi:hypothetical protein
MKISKMKEIFKIAHQSNDTVRMVGLHGIGKSQIVESFAEENNFHIETLFLSQQETADLIGIPDMKDGVTYWTKPVWLKRMEDASKQNKHCILFCDELARAPLEVRQAALQLVLEGRIHEHSLPRLNGLKTLVIAADNPSEDYQTDELDPALLDRFGNYNVEVDVKGWLDWARKNNLNPIVTDYIAEYPDKLHFIPEDDNDKGATPRSWSKLSDLMNNFDSISSDLQYPVILSKLGSTVGNSFFHFYGNYVKIVKPDDLKEWLKDEKIDTKNGIQKAAKKISKRTQQIEALAASELANKIKELTKEDKIWNNILSTFLDSINVEIFVSIIKTWKENTEDAEFYYSWAETVPEGFIFTKVLEIKENA